MRFSRGWLLRVGHGAMAAAFVAACTDVAANGQAPIDASVGCPLCIDASVSIDATTGVVDASQAIDASDASDAARLDAARPDASDASDASLPDAPDTSVAEAGFDAGVTTDDASTAGEGCADGTREGLLDGNAFPDVAACAGAWVGEVALAGPLCAGGWSVCTGAEPALTAVTYTAATAFPGCFAFDAAQDNYVCHPSCAAAVAAGVDSAQNIDMGAIGGNCLYQFPGTGSCITGGRIDASENSGTGCGFFPGITGIVCCRDAM